MFIINTIVITMSNFWPSVGEATILIIGNANTKILVADDLGEEGD